MRIADYLTARAELPHRFATRASIPWATLQGVLAGGDCRVTTARAIVTASRAEPTADGGSVGYEDLAIAAADRKAS